jgi:hypothetical protein
MGCCLSIRSFMSCTILIQVLLTTFPTDKNGLLWQRTVVCLYLVVMGCDPLPTFVLQKTNIKKTILILRVVQMWLPNMLYVLLEHQVTFSWETKVVNNYKKYFFFCNNKIKVFLWNNNTQKLKWRLLKTPKRIIVHIICPSQKYICTKFALIGRTLLINKSHLHN